MLGESPQVQKAKIEEAAKGATDLTNLVKRKKGAGGASSSAASPAPASGPGTVAGAENGNGKRKRDADMDADGMAEGNVDGGEEKKKVRIEDGAVN